TIDIFFVEGFSKRGTPVAMYSKDKGVKVYSQEALEKVKHLYDTYRMEKNNGLPLFDDLTAHRE
ncbi:MAG: hypothetical protein K2X98_06355, partial [Alphaproteobacteria bacterium]|nr:hypothetical protein [Alphaproteobacteria bacterium]